MRIIMCENTHKYTRTHTHTFLCMYNKNILLSIYLIQFNSIIINFIDAEAPANVSVSPIPYRGKLMAQWTPPEVDKGLSISWYIVEYKEVLPDSNGNFSSQLVKANTDFITVIGLKTGFTYSVRVAAITQLGTGTYSGLVYGRTFRGECMR